MSEDDVENNKNNPSDDFNATESAVKLAYDNKVNIHLIEGSGKDGRVLKSDVKKHIDRVESEIEEERWSGKTKYVYEKNGRVYEHLDEAKIIERVESDILEREANDEENQ